MHGAVAQLGEHLLCKQGVTGSIPVSSTIPTAQRKRQIKPEKANGDGLTLERAPTRSLASFAFSLFNNLE